MTDRTWSVLVVDDDFRVAGVHADIVEAAPGFSVSNTARSLAEATEAIKVSPPDLMLVDVFLPDGDGIERSEEHTSNSSHFTQSRMPSSA